MRQFNSSSNWTADTAFCGSPEGGAASRSGADTLLSSETSVPRLIALQADKRPDDVAVADGVNALTYGELNARSNALASCLRSRGVASNAIVGLCAERSIAHVVGALGIMKAGGAYLPLDPAYPKERLALEIDDAAAVCVVTVEPWTECLPRLTKRVHLTVKDGKVLGHELRDTAFENLDDEALAYVIYTSGSTGQPKGVEIRHKSLSNLVRWHRAAFNVSESDRASHAAAVGFDAAIWELWPYLTAGASIHIAKDAMVKDPLAFRDWLVAQGITITFIPTPLAECMMDLEWPSDSALRIMLTGGDVLHRYPRHGLPFQVVNNYGPTECTVVATSTIVSPEADCDHLPAVGRPITNASVFVLDEKMRQMPDGKEGEIWIAGTGLARGYRNKPNLTAEKFVVNRFGSSSGVRMYRTGDRGVFLRDGQLSFLGRMDDQIKIRGYRIEPAEIEALLNQYPGVRQSAVVAQETATAKKRLIACLVMNEQHPSTADEIQAHLESRLPKHMMPSDFVPMATLPMTPSGKVDRTALRSISIDIRHDEGFFVAGRQRDELVAPRDNIERQLQGIWQEILGVRSAGIQDDFFKLGGDSLQAACLFAEITRRLRVTLPTSALLECRTIEKLAQRIRGNRGDGTSLIAIRPQGSRKPIFCVHNHTGDVLFCRSFPKYIDAEQPVYGLQSRALNHKPAHCSVESMAAHYLGELRNVQHTGPYFLFGFSFGGLVAFEIACRLMEQDERVAFLGMFNTPAPGSLKGWPLRQVSYLRGRIRNELVNLRELKASEKAAHLYRNTVNFARMITRSVNVGRWRVVARRAGRETAVHVDVSDVAAINIAAAKNYVPRGFFAGRITFFVASTVPYLYAVPARAGWGAFATEGVEMVDIPDQDCRLNEALAKSVSEKLKRT